MVWIFSHTVLDLCILPSAGLLLTQSDTSTGTIHWMQPLPRLSSHPIDGLGRLIEDHCHSGKHVFEIPSDTEAMLLQLEVAVQELRSSLIAAGPVAFRHQQDLDSAHSDEHVRQQWAMCCSLWVSQFEAGPDPTWLCLTGAHTSFISSGGMPSDSNEISARCEEQGRPDGALAGATPCSGTVGSYVFSTPFAFAGENVIPTGQDRACGLLPGA